LTQPLRDNSAANQQQAVSHIMSATSLSKYPLKEQDLVCFNLAIVLCSITSHTTQYGFAMPRMCSVQIFGFEIHN